MKKHRKGKAIVFDRVLLIGGETRGWNFREKKIVLKLDNVF